MKFVKISKFAKITRIAKFCKAIKVNESPLSDYVLYVKTMLILYVLMQNAWPLIFSSLNGNGTLVFKCIYALYFSVKMYLAQ